MNISIKNCNNIDEGYMEIVEGALNIKYAINGTGKSTISKALEAFITNDDDKKKDLIPFKFADNPNDHMPEVCGYEQIKKLQFSMKDTYKIMFFNQQSLLKIALKYL